MKYIWYSPQKSKYPLCSVWQYFVEKKQQNKQKRARDLTFFTTDLQTVNYITKITVT